MPWTTIPKPNNSTTTSVVTITAQPFGLLMALTSVIGTAVTTTSVTGGWGGVAKPTSSTWTGVSKPTSSIWVAVPKPNP